MEKMSSDTVWSAWRAVPCPKKLLKAGASDAESADIERWLSGKSLREIADDDGIESMVPFLALSIEGCAWLLGAYLAWFARLMETEGFGEIRTSFGLVHLSSFLGSRTGREVIAELPEDACACIAVALRWIIEHRDALGVSSKVAIDLQDSLDDLEEIEL